MEGLIPEDTMDSNKFFTLEIDHKQVLDEQGKYYHVLKYIYKQRKLAVGSDFDVGKRNILSGLTNYDDNGNGINESEDNDSDVEGYKYIGKEINKTEEELASLAKELEQGQAETIFNDPGKTDLNLMSLERLINRVMNQHKTSLIRDPSIQSMYTRLSDFLGIHWKHRRSSLWLQRFSLCTEFPKHFMISTQNAQIIFPIFLVKFVLYTNKHNIFNLKILIRENNETISIIHSLTHIENFCKTQFPNLSLPVQTENSHFKKDLKYLLNVCLNEISDEHLLCSFLKINKLNLPSILDVDIPKVSLEIESFYGGDEDPLKYRLIFEFLFPNAKRSEVVRSQRQFDLLSHNLRLRFGKDYAIRLELFSNISYVKNWVNMLLENPSIWRSTEFKIFVNFFVIEETPDSLDHYYVTYTSKTRSGRSDVLEFPNSNTNKNSK
jgi:hypothetical protein